jgi:hypothetical protein
MPYTIKTESTQAYPNAVSENRIAYFSGQTLIINLLDGENYIASLYRITGQKLGEWKFNGTANTTNWSSLPRGTYLLAVETLSTKRVMKVLKW